MDYQNYFTYAWASLGAHFARMRAALRDRDRGASAVELAFITAGLLIVAGVIYIAIKTFVTNQANKINSNTGP